MNLTRKKGAAGAIGLIVSLFALLGTGLIPAQAATSVNSVAVTNHTSCTTSTPYEEWKYTKTYPKVNEKKHQEHRWNRTYSGPKEIFGATWSGSTTPTRTPSVWGAVPASLNPPGANSIAATGTVPAGTYNLPQDSDLTTPGVQPWQYRYQTPNGGIQWFPSETGWATEDEFDNAANIDIGYSGNGWQVVASQWVIDVVGSAARTVWLGTNNTEVDDSADAVWVTTNPGGAWAVYDHRSGNTTTNVPCAASGDVKFTDTYCDALTPVGNSLDVTLNDGTTAEGFGWNGTAYVSIGNIPAGNFGDALIGTNGFPAKIRVVLTGEDGIPLPPFEHTFPTASNDAAACLTVIPPTPTGDEQGGCVAAPGTGLSYTLSVTNPLPTAPGTVTTPITIDEVIDGTAATHQVLPGDTYTVTKSYGEDSGSHSGTLSWNGDVLATFTGNANCADDEVTPVLPTYKQPTCADPNGGKNMVSAQPTGVTVISSDDKTGKVVFGTAPGYTFPAGFNPVWQATIVKPGSCGATLPFTGSDPVMMAFGALLAGTLGTGMVVGLVFAIILVATLFRRRRGHAAA